MGRAVRHDIRVRTFDLGKIGLSVSEYEQLVMGGMVIQAPLRAATHTAHHVHTTQAFHNFEVFSGLSQSKVDPTQPKNEAKQARQREQQHTHKRRMCVCVGVCGCVGGALP